MPTEKQLTIKFSNHYTKLGDKIPDKVILLECFVKKSEELSEHFLDYDTQYLPENSNKFEYYTLPKAEPVIVLIFMVGDYISNRLFTTVRPYNYFKYKYYSENRGNEFILEILK